MLWRFSANNTHLYPGAVLRSLDAPSEARLSAGDELLVEFSDGIVASGRLLQGEPNAAVLQMPTYRTQRRTAVAARTWRIAPASGLSAGRADPAQPVRRYQGRQAARGGDSPHGFPLEASKARSAPSGARRHQAESSRRRLDSETGIHGDDEFTR
ncbi:hypothetical protein ACYTSM_02025 [Pseudomonas aeruginosa]|uniref:hypothetical protein n=1 Tax=Pseudomonas aeruginosa TaxID=287 RepID=UPI0021AE82FA|nr:hypothetical protein [Pseudomonas aeruginosa]HCF1728988.1 hypothetical protein [Pseudomonas aeruginosa]HCF4384136.1 hypothetical protein [Pseudomonas aeruginosa]